MGAAFVGLRNRGVNPFTTGLGTTLLLNLFLTFTDPGHLDRRSHRRARRRGDRRMGRAGAAVPPRCRTWATYAAPVAVMVISVAISVIVAGNG